MLADPQTVSATSDLALDASLRKAMLVVFAGLIVAAAAIDLRRFIIPDTIVVALLGLWPIWVVLSGHNSIGYTLFGAAGMFVLGIACFSFGFMGGGDVKLLTVIALWAEPGGLPGFILITSIAGGLLSICWLLPMRRLVAPVIGWGEGLRDNKQIPYGVAIAAGGIAVARRLWVG